ECDSICPDLLWDSKTVNVVKIGYQISFQFLSPYSCREIRGDENCPTRKVVALKALITFWGKMYFSTI
ncbi:MAG TPA: hypothetical protein VMW91_04030, partial [Desulfosporosinus sp.]|nr:hypothetical protein [Desulfosporosinus sp.]